MGLLAQEGWVPATDRIFRKSEPRIGIPRNHYQPDKGGPMEREEKNPVGEGYTRLAAEHTGWPTVFHTDLLLLKPLARGCQPTCSAARRAACFKRRPEHPASFPRRSCHARRSKPGRSVPSVEPKAAPGLAKIIRVTGVAVTLVSLVPLIPPAQAQRPRRQEPLASPTVTAAAR